MTVTGLFFSSLPLADVIFAYGKSNMAGKMIVWILFAGSVYAWSVMVTKMNELRRARRESDRFLTAYRKEPHPASLFLKREKYRGSPLYAVYGKTCGVLSAMMKAGGIDPSDLFMGDVGSDRPRLEKAQIDTVRNTAERSVADVAVLLEHSMGFLATATTAAPFLGLLGTVWGVMDAFAGMAVTGQNMLSAVAPGISGALLTTVVGLLVALPSVIGYNTLSNQIRRLTVETDNFAQELIADIERHFVNKQ